MYAFEIVFLLKNGKQTDGFHIPGRVANILDLSPVSQTNDDFIGDPDPATGTSPYWKIYNTGSVTGFSPGYSTSPDYKGPYQFGEFSYWESTEEYPCNEELWGDLAGQPIRVLGKQNPGVKRQFEKESADLKKKVKVTLNPHYKRGISTSIRRGLGVMDPRSGGILISLGDQPFLKTRTIDALIRAFHRGEGEIVVPSYRGRKGHPVIFHRRFEEELMKLRGDTGGRSILQKYPGKVKKIRVRSEGVTKDIDTKEEYRKALRRRGRDEKSDSGKIGKRAR